MRAAIAIIVVLALVGGGCGDDDSGGPQTTTAASTVQPTTSTTITDPADVIYGMWITELEGMYVTFNEDGSWTAQTLLDLEVFRDTGAFTFDGEVLTVRTDPAFECASYADEGSYGVDFTDVDTIRLTVIDDSCTGRANDFTSGLVRYSP